MKRMLLVLIIGALAGGTVVYNLMNDRDPFANPFQSDSLLNRVKDGGSELLEDGADSIREGLNELSD